MKFKRVIVERRVGLKKERVSEYHSEDGRLKIVPYFTSRRGVRMYANRSRGESRNVQVREKWLNILVDGKVISVGELWRVRDAKAEAELLVCPECKDYTMRDKPRWNREEKRKEWVRCCESCGHEVRESEKKEKNDG